MRSCSHLFLAATLVLCAGTVATWPSGGMADEGALATTEEFAVEQLLVELGSELWVRREQAQARLLEHGAQATARLREAIDSENLERAYRAQQLLNHLDPLAGRFEIFRIRLDPSPTVVSFASTRASAQEDVRLVPKAIGDHLDEGIEYRLKFQTKTDSELDIVVDRRRGGISTKLRLPKPSSSPKAISLIAVTEEASYRRIGQFMKRRRHRYLTVLRTWYGPWSKSTPRKLPQNETMLRSELIHDIVKQSKRGPKTDRVQAFELLSYLTRGQSDATFKHGVRNPATRPLAVLGADRRDLLKNLLEAPSETPSAAADANATSDLSPPVSVRAAVRLLQLGETESALSLVMERLLDANLEHLHYLTAEMADFVRRDGLSDWERDLIIDHVLSEVFLSRAHWSDLETHYLVAGVLDRVDPKNPNHVKRVNDFLTQVETSAQQRNTGRSVRVEDWLQLIDRIARKMPPDTTSRRKFLFRLIPSLLKDRPDYNTNRVLEKELRAGPLTDSELNELLGVLTRSGEVDDTVRYQTFLRLQNSLEIGPGQLRSVGNALLTIGKEIANVPREELGSTKRLRYLRQIVGSLNRLTGLNGAIGDGSSDFSEWELWLASDSAVAARQNALDGAQSEDPENSTFVLFEFELLLQDLGVGKTSVDKRPSQFEVLDARRIPLTVGQQAVAHDRWGNRLPRRLKKMAAVAANSGTREKPARRPQNYTLHPARIMVTPGAPLLGSINDRDTEFSWYETAPLFFGSRRLPTLETSGYRLLTLLVEESQSPTPPAEVSKSPDALWRWMVQHHVFSADNKTTPKQTRARILSLLEKVLVDGDLPVIRSVFAQDPTPQLARQLYVRGDTGGIEHFRKAVTTASGPERLRGAQLLASVGEHAGIEAIVKMNSENPRLLAGYRLGQTLLSVDAYLKTVTAAAERRKALRFIAAKLDQARKNEHHLGLMFRILQDAADIDFGYITARGVNDPDKRREAIRDAVDAALDWWHRQQ